MHALYKEQGLYFLWPCSLSTPLPPTSVSSLIRLGQQGFWHRRAGVGEDQGVFLVARYCGDMARHWQTAGQPWYEVAAVVR